MRGDFTRDTFKSSKHYSRVMLQQVRVQLDADWNEQSAIVLHSIRALARDLIGPHGAPSSTQGFEVFTDASKITGIDDSRRTVLANAVKNGDIVIGAGDYYVDGILVENEAPILYTEQPGYSSASLDELKADAYLLYLDVWERLITYVEDGHIREVALGGPDTAARSQIIWQVKVLKPMDSANAPACSATNGMPQIGTGRMRARARQDQPQTELCVIPPDAVYRGPENQLYRIEVHQGGKADGIGTAPAATIKWSRENGSVIFRILDIALAGATQTRVTLATLGRDERSGLKEGNWVEVLDEDSVLHNIVAPLLKVSGIDRDSLVVTLDGTTSINNAGVNKILRRWDQAGDATLRGAIPLVEHVDTDDGLKERWTDVEDDVQIWFAKGGDYHAGDYWLIPARTATGDIDWPHELNADGSERLDLSKNPIGAELPPRGTHHHFAPLARRGPGANLTDCRCIIKPVAVCPPEQPP